MDKDLNKRQNTMTRLRNFRLIFKLAQYELKSTVRLPLTKTLFAWRHGFLRDSALLYGFDKSTVKNYISDYALYFKTPLINGRFSEVVNNKIVFERFLQEFPGLVPVNFFFLHDNNILTLNNKYNFRTTNDLIDLIIERGAIVIKPIAGGGGRNIHVFKHENGVFLINQNPVTLEEVKNRLSKMNEYIGCELVEQGEYAADIFPHSVNTIRILTMWDHQTNETFIAAAIHRFGRQTTIPVDNFAKGGLSAWINQERGVLGKAVELPTKSELTWHSVHPDSGKPIEGVQVPDWVEVKNQILQIAQSIAFVPYIGWDIVKTRNGIKILEANNHSSMQIFQPHSPLLLAPRVRQFYQRHKIIQ